VPQYCGKMVSMERDVDSSNLLTRQAGDLPTPLAIEHFLRDAAATYPTVAALDFYDRVVTFAELGNLATRAAIGFQRLGVRPGTPVGLHLLNTPHYVVCFFGVLMAGGWVVNISPLLAPRELKHQLADSGVRLLVTSKVPALDRRISWDEKFDDLETIVVCRVEDFLAPDIASSIVGSTAGGMPQARQSVEFSELVANENGLTTYPHGDLRDEVAVLQYTGGTTGSPKGAMLTHANLSAVLHISAQQGELVAGTHRKTLMILPISHIFGLVTMLESVRAGNELVLHLRFDVRRLLGDIDRKKIAFFSGVPTMYTAIVNHPKVHEFDLSSLLRCSVGGAPFPADIRDRFKEITGLEPRSGYGLTETATLAARHVRNVLTPPGSVGFPASHTKIEIVDLQAGVDVLPPGEVGEICISGPQVMKGYWNNPEATAEAFRGGRFHTGDIGRLDRDGFLTLVDRKKDMVISAGLNVFPSDVERAIAEHPSVAEVAVIGLPDPTVGQLIKAFIVLKPGKVAPGIGELNQFLAPRLASYKIPAAVEFIDALPKTIIGKVLKQALLARHDPVATRPV